MTYEGLKAVPIPETKIEAREAAERKELVRKGFETTLASLHELDKQALSGSWSAKVYDEKTLETISGLRESFPQSAAVQEGIHAIGMTTHMVMSKIRLDKIQSQDLTRGGSGRLTHAVREDLLTTVLWQQHVASFLAGHAQLAAAANNPDSVHVQFMRAIDARAKRAHDLGNDVYRTPIATSNADAARDTMWQSAIGMSAAAQFFQGQGYDVHWADPRHDVYNSIDVFAEGDQEEFAIQLKTFHPAKLKRSEIIPTSIAGEFAYSSDVPLDIARAQSGVKNYNKTEGKNAIGLMLRLKYDTNQINPRAGVIQKPLRLELQRQLDPIIAQNTP